MTGPTTPTYPDIHRPPHRRRRERAFANRRRRPAGRRGGVGSDDVTAFVTEATSGDYDHVLQTAMRWVDVD